MNAQSTKETNEMNLQIARENQTWQQQENERAFNRDLQMWDMQNQYNSPAAQRARIEAAGGNAMLAFGNGIQATSGNATNAPSLAPAKAITPTLTPYQGWNIGSNTFMDNLIKLQLFKGQKQMQDAEIGIKQQEERKLGIENDILSGTKQYQIDKASEEYRNLKNENDYFEETKQTVIHILENNMKMSDENLNMIKKELKKIDNEIQLQEFELKAANILKGENYIFLKNFLMPLLQLGFGSLGNIRGFMRR